MALNLTKFAVQKQGSTLTGWITIYCTCAIITCSWILAIHKNRIFSKNLLENREMSFKKWVINIQDAVYNGECTEDDWDQTKNILLVFLDIDKKAQICLIYYSWTFRVQNGDQVFGLWPFFTSAQNWKLKKNELKFFL